MTVRSARPPAALCWVGAGFCAAIFVCCHTNIACGALTGCPRGAWCGGPATAAGLSGHGGVRRPTLGPTRPSARIPHTSRGPVPDPATPDRSPAMPGALGGRTPPTSGALDRSAPSHGPSPRSRPFARFLHRTLGYRWYPTCLSPPRLGERAMRFRFHGLRKLNWVERPPGDYGEHMRRTGLDRWLEPGPFAIVVGPNAGGKSTVVDLVRGLGDPSLWPSLARENYPNEDFSGFDVEGTDFALGVRFSRYTQDVADTHDELTILAAARGPGGEAKVTVQAPKQGRDGGWAEPLRRLLDVCAIPRPAYMEPFGRPPPATASRTRSSRRRSTRSPATCRPCWPGRGSTRSRPSSGGPPARGASACCSRTSPANAPSCTAEPCPWAGCSSRTCGRSCDGASPAPSSSWTSPTATSTLACSGSCSTSCPRSVAASAPAWCSRRTPRS